MFSRVKLLGCAEITPQKRSITIQYFECIPDMTQKGQLSKHTMQ